MNARDAAQVGAARDAVPAAVGGAWPRRALAILAGAAAGFAHPPWGFLPGLIGYALMMALIDRADGRRPLRSAFFTGWLVGAGYFLVCVWWISEPFQIDAAEQGWMAPFAVVGVAAFMALFWGAAALAYRAVAGRGVTRVLVFAAALSLCEWLRGHVLTGFPWDLPGETWTAGSAISQAAALVGAYGLTWLTVAIAAAPALIAEGWKGRAAAVAAAAVLAGLFAFGQARLSEAPATRPDAPLIRVVQPDLAQKDKYDRRLFAGIVGRYVRLSAAPAARAPDIVVWPEGAIPAALDEYLAPGTWTAAAIADVLTPRQTLILGAYRYGADARGRPVIFNALASVRADAGAPVVTGLYDKHRLVPFGEFMPLDGLAARLGIKQLVHVGDGFAPGPPPRPLRLAELPTVQPLICYEALYPGFTREGWLASGLRAGWIVVVSNDAWFGTGSGPVQHLNMARYRAIEEGLPMVRATPTGISAVIDAEGRVAPGQSLGEGVMGVIDAALPPALAPTPFARLGDGPFWLMLALSLAGARLGVLRPRRAERP